MKILITLLVATNCYADNAVSPGDTTPDGKWTYMCVTNRPMDGSKEALASCSTDPTAKGEYGLVMANVDQANLDSPSKGVKYSSINKIIGSNAQSDSNGVANTQAIINAFPNDTRENNAAKLCSEYLSPNQQNPQKPIIQGYLGAKDELDKMYEYASNPNNNLIGRNCQGDKSKEGGTHCLIGGWSEEDKVYHSSTEHAGYIEYTSWSQSFSNGYQYDWFSSNESHCLGVRALGVFNPLTLQLFNTLKKKIKIGISNRLNQKQCEEEKNLFSVVNGNKHMLEAMGE